MQYLDLVKAVGILIKNGANINAANKQTGNTALMVAAKNGKSPFQRKKNTSNSNKCVNG